MRKLSIAITALALALSIFAPSAQANPGLCQTYSGNYFTGYGRSPFTSGNGVSGARALITNESGNVNAYEICNNPGTVASGPSAWVGIAPNPSTQTSQILQLGVIECTVGAGDPCSGNNHPHFFWAMGGCGSYVATPRDIWAEVQYNHTYVIYESADGNYHLTIDTTPIVTISPSDPAISCWINKTKSALWYGEKWNIADSLGTGTAPAFPLTWSNVWYGVLNQGWFNALNTSTCSGVATYDTCVYQTSSSYYSYTTH